MHCVMTVLIFLKLIGVSSPNCFPAYDDFVDCNEEFYDPLDVLETHFPTGRQQCRHRCYDVGNCVCVRYDQIKLTCEILGYLLNDYEVSDGECDYVFRDTRNGVCSGLITKTDLHSGETVCYEDRLQNIALGASGYPSSTPGEGYSFHYAVDGITNTTDLLAGTNTEEFPYLVLDLGKPFAVDRVEIYGTLIDSSVEVRVGMSEDWETMEVCHYFEEYHGQADGHCYECLIGQYVTVKRVGEAGYDKTLVVKEIKVYGR